MTLSVDVKRVNVNLENLSVQYDNAKAMLTQQYNMMKYVIDYPADKDIAVEKVDIDDLNLSPLTGLNEWTFPTEAHFSLIRFETGKTTQRKNLPLGFPRPLGCRHRSKWHHQTLQRHSHRRPFRL